MELYDLVIPFGITTYTLLILAALIGKRIIKINFKWHPRIALTALIFGTMYAGIILYYRFF